MVCDALTKLMCTAMLVAFVSARKFVVPTAGQKRTVKAAEVLALSMASLTGCAATAAANGPDAQQPVVIRGIEFAHDYFENVYYWLKLGFGHYTGLGEEHAMMSLDSILVMLALYMLIRMLVSLMATLLRPRTVRTGSSACTVRRSWTCTSPTRRSSMYVALLLPNPRCSNPPLLPVVDGRTPAAPFVNELRRPRSLLP